MDNEPDESDDSKFPLPPGAGAIILEVAEKLEPWLTNVFKGLRDNDGHPAGRAQVRSIALHTARSVVIEQIKKHEPAEIATAAQGQ